MDPLAGDKTICLVVRMYITNWLKIGPTGFKADKMALKQAIF